MEPPGLSPFSWTATSAPSSLARAAATSPAIPAPATISSATPPPAPASHPAPIFLVLHAHDPSRPVSRGPSPRSARRPTTHREEDFVPVQHKAWGRGARKSWRLGSVATARGYVREKDALCSTYSSLMASGPHTK